MQLYFIRHGQSENNALWDQTETSINRVEDPRLTEKGIKQAELVAEFIDRNGSKPTPASTIPNWDNYGALHLTHLYTSLMVRAVATGDYISRRTGIPLVACMDLHECGGIFIEDGDIGPPTGLPGKNRTFYKNTYPALTLPDSLGNDGWWNRPFEDKEECNCRAERVLARLTTEHQGKDHRVGLVTHGGFYGNILRALLGISADREMWFSLNNTGITRIDVSADFVNVVYLNRVDFLPPHLIT